MFSRWEKVSGVIMEGPTVGRRADAASGKSSGSAGRKKKPPAAGGRLTGIIVRPGFR